MRALVYVRLSDWRGEEDPSLSPQGQEEAGRAYCKSKGWDVVDVVRDLDQSGSDKGLGLSRPGIKELRTYYGKADAVVFKRLDRLARDVADFGALMKEARANGMALVSINEGVDMTTDQGEFFATIVMAFAQMESRMIAARVKDGRREQRTARRWGGGFTPWGYESAPNPDGPGRVLIVKKDEAEILKECAARVVRGESLYSIGQDLVRRGVPGKRSGTWDATKIKRIVTSPASVGVMMHGKEPLRDELGLPVRAWPAALDPDLQAQARAALKPGKKSGQVKRQKAARLLSGLIVCPSCRRSLALKSVRGVVQYACSSRARGLACAGGVSVRAESAESEVERRLLLKIGSWRRLLDVAREVAPDREALRDIEQALGEIGMAFQEPTADVPALVARRDALLQMRENLGVTEPVHETVESSTTVREEWDHGDVIDRQKLLQEYVRRVTVRPSQGRRGFSPDRIVIEWGEFLTIDQPEHGLIGEGFWITSDDPETLRRIQEPPQRAEGSLTV
ncbi:recombinase family protein [Krasilnikoviella flava]|uniref:Site-specific DNA recombinase n=1 Tax=Krasilnikoviella flava TaxID=526729 RepID=A0A1T5JQ98_9MICO|nr:recombinase family protein [Krasilnikoviella flava]SKC53493.1 Site-specific DNA recombinase [Krasilnikoviella flava]